MGPLQLIFLAFFILIYFGITGFIIARLVFAGHETEKLVEGSN